LGASSQKIAMPEITASRQSLERHTRLIVIRAISPEFSCPNLHPQIFPKFNPVLLRSSEE
jgi:hypothetical protein